MKEVVQLFPQPFFYHTKGCYGVKQRASASSIPKLDTSSVNPFVANKVLRQHATYIVDKPLVVTSKTLLTQSKEFVKGCSYTISLWVWIWDKFPRSTHLKGVLTSHETFPNVGNKHSLLPAILYNVGLGKKRDQFFFSMARGKHSEDYLGIWAGSVRFRKWTHLALTVEGNTMKIYQDGTYLDYLMLDFQVDNTTYVSSQVSDTKPVVVPRCALEHNNFIMQTRCLDQNSSSHKLIWGEEQSSRNIRVPNAVLWVGGSRTKDARMTGMIQDLLLFENQALSGREISTIMNAGKPSKSFNASLEKLLDLYTNENHGYGMCEMRGHGTFYMMISWGFCPEEVCGEVCFTSSFLNQPKLDSQAVFRMTSNLLFAQHKKAMGKDVILSSSQALTESSGIDEVVPDIGHIVPVDQRTMKMKYGSKNSMSASVIKKVISENYAHLHLDKYRQIVEKQFNNTALASILSYLFNQTNIESNSESSTNKTSNYFASEDASSYYYQRWDSERGRDSYYLADEEGKVQGLYKLAMSVMSSRHAMQFLHQFNVSYSTWGSTVSDISYSALALGAILADEVHRNVAQNLEDDTPWSFEYYKHLSQPIFLALGNRMGVEGEIAVFDGEAILQRLKSKGYTLPPIKVIDQLRFKEDGNSANFSLALNASLEYDTFIFPSANNDNSILKILLRKLKKGDVYNSAGEAPTSDDSLSSEAGITGKLNYWGKKLSKEKDKEKKIIESFFPHKENVDSISSMQRIMFDTLAGIPISEFDTIWREFSTAYNLSSSTQSFIYESNVTYDYLQKNPSRNQANCHAAASYYFPIAQYVTAHYGSSKAGVGVLDEVRLVVSKGQVQGYAGEEDSSHQLTEFDALAGDPDAQTWLGKKYFWGLGGLQRNEQMAREWFERAAAQNHPEGLYNLGCFYANGQGGVAKDPQRAMEFFRRAANADKPFFMAVNAVAQFYMTDPKEKNYTIAKEYLLKAADMGSDDALFSLATIAREGLAGPADIPLSVFYLARASTNGHMRSTSFLAHGLYDSNSWYSQFGREQLSSLKNQFFLRSLNRSSDAIEMDDSATPAIHSSTTLTSDQSNQTSSSSLLTDFMKKFHPNVGEKLSDNKKIKTPQSYNSSEPIHIILRDGHVVKLPFPLGSQVTSKQGEHTDSEASLAMLRFLSHMSYRTKDLSYTAMKAFVQEDKVTAAKLYEEAADLGLASAQENSAFIMEQLKEEVCRNFSSSYDNSSSPIDLQAWEQCKQMFDTMAMRRWLQLAKSGEPLALRKVAERILMNHGLLSTDHYHLADLSKQNLVQHVSAHTISKKLEILKEFTVDHAIDYLAIASRMGSTESLVDLGWLAHLGYEGRPGNSSIALEIFQVALKMEAMGSQSVLNTFLRDQRKAELAKTNHYNSTKLSSTVKETHYLPPLLSEKKSTGGVAPAVAIGMIYFEQMLDQIFGEQKKEWKELSGQVFQAIESMLSGSASSLNDNSSPLSAPLSALQHPQQRITILIFIAITFFTIVLLCLLWLLWKIL